MQGPSPHRGRTCATGAAETAAGAVTTILEIVVVGVSDLPKRKPRITDSAPKTPANNSRPVGAECDGGAGVGAGVTAGVAVAGGVGGGGGGVVPPPAAAIAAPSGVGVVGGTRCCGAAIIRGRRSGRPPPPAGGAPTAAVAWAGAGGLPAGGAGGAAGAAAPSPNCAATAAACGFKAILSSLRFSRLRRLIFDSFKLKSLVDKKPILYYYSIILLIKSQVLLNTVAITISLYNQEGKEIDKLELNKAIFGLPWNADLVHQAVRTIQANSRQILADTKNRGKVRGGGRKPWKQKGTGRARHGSIRSPLWRHGGVSFGPTSQRNFKLKINKKMARKALLTVLSAKVKDWELLVIDDLKLAAPKTKEMAKILKNFPQVKKGLIVLTQKDKNVFRASRNLPSIKVIPANNLNIVDILKYKHLILTKAVIDLLKL